MYLDLIDRLKCDDDYRVIIHASTRHDNWDVYLFNVYSSFASIIFIAHVFHALIVDDMRLS
jgi:hypothetical protein